MGIHVYNYISCLFRSDIDVLCVCVLHCAGHAVLPDGARVYVCCSVLGTPFYLMEHVFVCAASVLGTPFYLMEHVYVCVLQCAGHAVLPDGAPVCVCCSVLGTPFYLMQHVLVCAAVCWARRST